MVAKTSGTLSKRTPYEWAAICTRALRLLQAEAQAQPDKLVRGGMNTVLNPHFGDSARRVIAKLSEMGLLEHVCRGGSMASRTVRVATDITVVTEDMLADMEGTAASPSRTWSDDPQSFGSQPDGWGSGDSVLDTGGVGTDSDPTADSAGNDLTSDDLSLADADVDPEAQGDVAAAGDEPEGEGTEPDSDVPDPDAVAQEAGRIIQQQDEELERLRRELRGSQQTVDQLTGELAGSQQRDQEAAQAILELEAELKTLRGEKASLEAENERLKTANGELQTENSALQGRLDAQVAAATAIKGTSQLAEILARRKAQ